MFAWTVVCLRSRIWILTTASLALGSFACRSGQHEMSLPQSSPERAGLPIKVLYESPEGGLRHALRAVVDTREEFERLWREIHSGVTPLPALPTVDFKSEMVIVASAGSQASVGSEIAITEVRDHDGVLDVTVEVRPFPVGCPGYPKVTYPTVMVLLPATLSTAVFRDRIIETRYSDTATRRSARCRKCLRSTSSRLRPTLRPNRSLNRAVCAEADLASYLK